MCKTLLHLFAWREYWAELGGEQVNDYLGILALNIASLQGLRKLEINTVQI